MEATFFRDACHGYGADSNKSFRSFLKQAPSPPFIKEAVNRVTTFDKGASTALYRILQLHKLS